jgi:ribulose-phosphate 3-epimerase
VPNITMGPAVTRAIRGVTRLPLDVHLMIEQPDRYVEAFAEAGADSLTVHFEASPHLHRTVQRIRELGVRAGVAVNPATPAEALVDILPHVDLVLVMTVNPGFGGQSFIPGSEGKVGRVRSLLAQAGRVGVDLQVDGGIDAGTVGGVVAAGATVIVAGSAIFGAGSDVGANLERLRAAAEAVERTDANRL